MGCNSWLRLLICGMLTLKSWTKYLKAEDINLKPLTETLRAGNFKEWSFLKFFIHP